MSLTTQLLADAVKKGGPGSGPQGGKGMKTALHTENPSHEKLLRAGYKPAGIQRAGLGLPTHALYQHGTRSTRYGNPDIIHALSDGSLKMMNLSGGFSSAHSMGRYI